MRASTRLAVAMVIACAALSARAWAQGNEIETQHTRGMSLRREGRHEEARQLFRQLWERTREPRALARMALAEGALGLWVDAEAHLSQALAAAADPWIAANRTALEGNLESQREHVGEVDVRSDTPGARASVRGAPEVPLPFAHPVRVPTGQVVIEVTAPGFRPQRRVVNARPLAAGATVELFALERLRPDETAGPPAPSQAGRYVGYGLLGLGAILAGLSTWQYVTAGGLASNAGSAGFNSEEPYRSWFFYYNQTNPQGTLSTSEVCDRAQTDAVNAFAAETRGFCSRVATANSLAVGFLIPGAVSLVTGAVLIATAPRATPAPRVAVTPWMGPSTSGLTLAGSF